MTQLNEIKGIVNPHTLWGAIKYSGKLSYVEVCGHIACMLDDGTVVAMNKQNWNDILALALLDQNLQELEIPRFKIVTVSDIRIGMFDELYKNGYVVFTLDGEVGYDNLPLVIMKGAKEC